MPHLMYNAHVATRLAHTLVHWWSSPFLRFATCSVLVHLVHHLLQESRRPCLFLLQATLNLTVSRSFLSYFLAWSGEARLKSRPPMACTAVRRKATRCFAKASEKRLTLSGKKTTPDTSIPASTGIAGISTLMSPSNPSLNSGLVGTLLCAFPLLGGDVLPPHRIPFLQAYNSCDTVASVSV